MSLITAIGPVKIWKFFPIPIEGNDMRLSVTVAYDKSFDKDDYDILYLYDVIDGKEPVLIDSKAVSLSPENKKLTFEFTIPGGLTKGPHTLKISQQKINHGEMTKDRTGHPRTYCYVNDWLTVLAACGLFLSVVGIMLPIILKVL